MAYILESLGNNRDFAILRIIHHDQWNHLGRQYEVFIAII